MAEQSSAKRRPAGESAPPALTSDQIRAQQVFDLYQALPADMQYQVADTASRETHARLMKTSRAYRTALARPLFYEDVVLRTTLALRSFLQRGPGESTWTLRTVKQLYAVLDAPFEFGPWNLPAPTGSIQGLADTERLFFIAVDSEGFGITSVPSYLSIVLGAPQWTQTIQELVLSKDIVSIWAKPGRGKPAVLARLKRLHIFIQSATSAYAHHIDLTAIDAPNLQYFTVSVGSTQIGPFEAGCAIANATITQLNPRVLNRYIDGETAEEIIADAINQLKSFPKEVNLDRVALMPWSASLATLDKVFEIAPARVQRAIRNAFRKIPWAACGAMPGRVFDRADKSVLTDIRASTYDIIRARFASHPRHVAEYAPVCAAPSIVQPSGFQDYVALMVAGSMLRLKDPAPRFALTPAQVNAVRFIVRRFPEIPSPILPCLATLAFNNPITPTIPFLPEDIYDVTSEWICAMVPVLMKYDLATWVHHQESRKYGPIHEYFASAIGVPLPQLRLHSFTGYGYGHGAYGDVSRDDNGATPVPLLTEWAAAATALRFFYCVWHPSSGVVDSFQDYLWHDSRGTSFTTAVALALAQLIDALTRANVPELIRASQRLARRVWSYLWRRAPSPQTTVVLCAILARSGTLPTEEALALSHVQQPGEIRGNERQFPDENAPEHPTELERNPAFRKFALAHKAAVQSCLEKLDSLIAHAGVARWAVYVANSAAPKQLAAALTDMRSFFSRIFDSAS